MSGARALLVASALLVSSCTVQSDIALWMRAARSTGSGVVRTVRDLLELGKSAKQNVEETAGELQQRAAEVQSGVHLILKGKEMIEGAVK